MNCSWVEEKLSAYIDRELNADERRQIESHFEQCNECRELLAEFRAIGTLMRQSEPSTDIDAVWDRISSKLDENAVIPMSTQSKPKSWIYVILATAASIALMWFVAKNNLTSQHGDESHEHAALAVDFQEVVQSARTEPKAAIAKLVSKYQGKELDPNATAKYLGYEPAIYRGIPDGFARVSTHVLNMPRR